MSEELENSVREMLKEETWTRAGISNFTKNNLMDLSSILETARADGTEGRIKEICDEQLIHTRDSIVALYISGMVALRTGSLDNSALTNLADIFEKNHKEALVEYLCQTILEEDPQNKFALRKLASYYEETNDPKVWDLYEQIVKLDFEEADIAKILADRYKKQGNTETAVSYYKKALLRYVSAKNSTAVKETWSKLVALIPEEIDFFLLVQRKIAKSISEDKSSQLMQELYQYYKDTNIDVAIDILKLILSIDNKDGWARREIVECYRTKYADHSHLEDYIKSSNLNQSVRNVFEAISDFEKHIAFDAKNFVYHRTWGVGLITKVQGDKLTINFGKKGGIHEPTLKMAVSSLQPLSKNHIWVLKATKKREELSAMVKGDVTWTLKTIIQSFSNSCDDKRIKAELVPAVLTPGEWTSWHAKAKNILANDSTFGVNPNDISLYTVRDREISMEERLANEFKAEKDFFKRLAILMRFVQNDSTDKNDELFTDMFSYFTSYLKSFTSVNEQVMASYLVVQSIAQSIPSLSLPDKITFEGLYREIENPREMYVRLKDPKETNLQEMFIKNVRNQLSDWDAQYVRLFPTVLDKRLLDDLVAAGHEDKVVRLVQDAFTEYRNYRDAAVFFFRECRAEPWFPKAGISEERQLVTLVNIIALCWREINSHVNTVDNKKTIKAATTLLFANKTDGGQKNTMLDFMLANDRDTITRMYTMINDVRELDSSYKAQLRNGILGKYPDFKFQEAEIKQEAPKGLIVTAKKLEEKKALAEDLEKVQLVQIAKEVSEAREKGDLKENAEYQAAKERQHRINEQFGRLKEEISRAVIFDQTTVTTSVVSFGTTVTLQNNLENKEEILTILGPWESNAEQGIISYMSPLGNALLDAKEGETREFTINEHKYNFTVKSITAAKLD